MTDYKVTQAATYQSIFETNSNAVWIDLNANEGTTRAEVVTRTALNALIVDSVLEILEKQGLAIRRYDVAGTEYWWTAEDWATAVRTQVAAARIWLAANNNGLTSAMAVSLGVHEAVAITLARILEHEASAKITAV